MCQSIGVCPDFTKSSFAFEKHLQPKKPLYAERGLGWGAQSLTCSGLSIAAAFARALAPHSKNTIGVSFLLSSAIIRSVKLSQPLPLWLLGQPSRTVSTALSIKTPCLAQLIRCPLPWGMSISRRRRGSLSG